MLLYSLLPIFILYLLLTGYIFWKIHKERDRLISRVDELDDLNTKLKKELVDKANFYSDSLKHIKDIAPLQQQNAELEILNNAQIVALQSLRAKIREMRTQHVATLKELQAKQIEYNDVLAQLNAMTHSRDECQESYNRYYEECEDCYLAIGSLLPYIPEEKADLVANTDIPFNREHKFEETKERGLLFIAGVE